VLERLLSEKDGSENCSRDVSIDFPQVRLIALDFGALAIGAK